MLEVVAALIRRENRFLICQRPRHKARAMQWEFPGGKVETGETGPQAIVREIREELNAGISVEGKIADTVYDYPDLSVHLNLYLAVPDSEPQCLEHNQIRWITSGEIPDYDFCPADRAFLAKIREVMA